MCALAHRRFRVPDLHVVSFVARSRGIGPIDSGGTLTIMERPRRPDLDESLSLDLEPEDVLRRLLNAEDVPPDEDDPLEDDS